MKVFVEPDCFDSDYFEVSDDITEDEANVIACEWICNNISGILRRVDGKPMPWEKRCADYEGN